VAAVALLMPAAAAAVPVRIAFTAGDRLMVMKGDGSGRTQIRLRSGLLPGQPAWSPDRARLAFTGFDPDNGDGAAPLFTVGPDGTNLRTFTARQRDTRDESPAWSPDGSRLAFVRNHFTTESGVTELITIGADGSDARVLRTQTAGTQPTFFSAVTWSADGTQLVYTVSPLDSQSAFVPSLRSIGADGSGDRQLLPDAQFASFSPDGTRIAYSTPVHPVPDCSPPDDCTTDGKVFVMNADGSGAHRVTNTVQGDEQAPGWSPDGQRIAFTSNRNYPSGDAYEIYSVRPDGSCLTWLTNGSPGSFFGSWEPGPALSSDPGGCGAAGRAPVFGLDLADARARRHFRVWWLGTSTPDGLLLSDVAGSRREMLFGYDDCARFDPADCPGNVDIVNLGECDRTAYDLNGFRPARLQRLRRALVYTVPIAGKGVEIYMGRTVVALNVTDAARVREVASRLRLFGATKPPARLPRAGFRRGVWAKLDRARAAVRRTGSVRAAARLLHLSPHRVRSRLAVRRKLVKYRARRLSC
jgi:dipeptidyl aminopeptidase/acylaminoacyl peptidase